LSFKFQLDWTYRFGDIAIVRFRHIGWKMPIRAYFSGFFVDFDLLKFWYFCSDPQRNAIFSETRVLRHYSSNRSSGLTPSCADEQI